MDRGSFRKGRDHRRKTAAVQVQPQGSPDDIAHCVGRRARCSFAAMLRPLLPLLALALPALAIDDYKLGPNSQVQPGVPQGEVTKHTFANSEVYPRTTRDYWVYVPKQYDAAKPACLMVFQDGGGFAKPDG